MGRLTDLMQRPVRVLALGVLFLLAFVVLQANGLIPVGWNSSPGSGFQMSPEQHAHLLERESIEKMLRELESDPRKPTATDCSGVWSTGVNLVGYTVQLEQTGPQVSGHGYHWGCTGVYEPFEVSGNYDGNQLVLRTDGEPPSSSTFRWEEVDGLLRLRGVEQSSDRPIRDLVPRDDKRTWLNRYFSTPQEVETNDGTGEGSGIGDASKIQ